MLTQSSGWQLTLSHPDTGRTIAPDVLGDPEFLPSLNSLVEVRIPVRRSPDWVRWPDGTGMELRLDGRVQPVDELVDIEQEAGRTVLVGEGGSELEDRVTAEYQSERRHIAAEELIEANTSYAADVDTPTATTLFDELQQSADTTAEWLAVSAADDTSPVWFDGDQYRLHDTAHWIEGTDYQSSSGTDVFVSQEFSGSSPTDCFGSAVLLDSAGQSITYEFTTAYDWPAEDWNVGVRWSGGAVGTVTEVRVDGNTGTEVTGQIGDGNADDILWFTTSFGFGENNSTIPAGTYTVEVELTENPNNGDVWIDSIAPYDTRLSHNFDNDVTCVDGVNYLDGPGRVGDLWNAEFVDVTTPFSYTAAELTTSPSADTTAPKNLQVSPDQGTTWLPDDGSETDTNTVDVTLGDPSERLRARIGIGGHSPNGTQDATPRENYASQSIDAYELRADVSQESLLIDAVFDDSLESILNEIAGDEYVWSYRIENGTPTVSWTQPGERTADREPDFEANVSVNKQLRTWDAVTIQGSAQSADERFDGSTTFTALARDRIVPGSDSVTDPTDGTQFTRGEDYELRYNDGEIRILDSGDMSSGTEYEITYRYEAQGMYPTDYTGSNTLVETIPGIVSDRQAEQIAYVLLEIDPGVDSPRWTADVLLPRADQSFDPLEALSLVALELPDDATPLSVREPPGVTPEGIALRLGSRRALESALRSISNQVRTVSRRS